MELFFIRMLQKLLSDTLRIDPASHEIMSLIAQDADDFCRERVVEDSNNRITIGRISRCDSPLFDMFSRAITQLQDIGEEWFVRHVRPLAFHLGYPFSATDDSSLVGRTLPNLTSA